MTCARLLLGALLAMACAGSPFSREQSGEPTSDGGNGGSGSVASAAGTSSLTSGAGALTGGSPSAAGSTGPTLAAGAGGEPGAGATSTPEGGASGSSAAPDCENVPHWTVGCESAEPLTFVQYAGQLWRVLGRVTACDWHCPPEGAREPECELGEHRYELVGWCA